jgi:hypothetical protein
MRAIQPLGPYRDVVEARSPEDPVLTVRLGLREDSFKDLVQHNLATAVAQYHGIVQEWLHEAVHAFRGLNRPLMHRGDMQADKSVIVYSWRPEMDYVWTGSRFGGKPVAKAPPSNRVFVVLVREEPEKNLNIFGAIERWNWVAEDQELPEAPVDWRERYIEKLWSRF